MHAIKAYSEIQDKFSGYIFQNGSIVFFVPTLDHVHQNILDVLTFDHTLHYSSHHCVVGMESPFLQLHHIP